MSRTTKVSGASTMDDDLFLAEAGRPGHMHGTGSLGQEPGATHMEHSQTRHASAHHQSNHEQQQLEQQPEPGLLEGSRQSGQPGQTTVPSVANALGGVHTRDAVAGGSSHSRQPAAAMDANAAGPQPRTEHAHRRHRRSSHMHPRHDHDHSSHRHARHHHDREAPPRQPSSVMRQTQVALGMWQQLQATAVTPSTVLPPVGPPLALAASVSSGESGT